MSRYLSRTEFLNWLADELQHGNDPDVVSAATVTQLWNEHGRYCPVYEVNMPLVAAKYRTAVKELDV